jgi:hypothetical protein
MTSERYHQALGYTLLAYMTLMTAVVTLVPFSFAVPKSIQFTLRGYTPDVLSNIVLFVPIGFFFQRTHDRIGLKSLFWALCFGLTVSFIVEAGQLFLPSRYSSVIDIITNGMGAGLGAMIAGYHQLMVRKARRPDRFGFGLPLISSVYLLIPLLWLGGIATGNEISRLVLMALVGVYGGGVISSTVVNRFRHGLRRTRLAVFGYATGWFVIGAVPALTHFPIAVLVIGIGVGVAALLSSSIWNKQNPTERRFELPTLKRLLPIYLLYLLLLSIWPTTVPLGEWSILGDFQSLGHAGRVLFISRFIEVIAAFTLLGYLVAEMSGRRDKTGLIPPTHVLLCIMGFATFITALRNALSEPMYILVEAVIFAIAGLCGAIIYRLQLAVVRSYGEERTQTSNGG